VTVRLPNTTVQDNPSGRATWSRAVVDALRGLVTQLSGYLPLTGGTLTGDLSVPDEAYGVGWNGSTEVPTKNALYDKIETISGGGVSDGDKGDIVVSGSGSVWSFDTGVVTAFAKTFLDDANAAAVRTTIGAQASGSYAVTTNNLSDLSNAGTARTNLGLAIGTDVQAFDADLAALAANSADGLWTHTGAGTGAARTLTAPAAGLTISNPAGIAGNPTFALANDLSALEAMSGTGLVARTASETYAQRTITAGTGISVSNGDGVSGNPTISTASFSGALVKKSADQTAANYSANPTVTWNAEEYDTDGYHDTGSNTDRLTVPSAGKYKVGFEVSVGSGTLTASDYVRASISRFNSSSVAQSFIGLPTDIITEISATPQVALSGWSSWIDCSSGDYFVVNFDTESDASITITASTSWFAIEKYQ
jgi:hypothetical protein